MKRQYKITFSLILIATLLITLAACSSGDSGIVGRWKKTEGGEFSYLEFFSDGTYKSSSANYEGGYSIDGNRLKLSGILVESKTYTFKIEGDTLFLYYSSKSNSPTAVFKKKNL
ncbi:MAG: hypothetical protein SOT80_03540 [Candidatus Pseudoruminococcus sp.]|nr:hypothetical protein [Ruminococcus sp.]MDY2782462.1 hypothetical protein [Candidatus Pseudoruminococcus sp.]